MKTKILLSFIFFMTLFSYAQRKGLKDNRHYEKSRVESPIKKLNRGDNKYREGHLFIKSRDFFQNSRINSSKSISSPLVIKNRLDYEKYLNWDETSSQWLDGWKYEYTYDTNGNLTQKFVYLDGSQRVNIYKYKFTYDTNGNKTQEIGYRWISEISQWVYGWKKEYTYDTNGNLTQEIDQAWGGSPWVNDYKYEYTYDTNGNLTQEIGYWWSGSRYRTETKIEFTYDTKGSLTQTSYFYWFGSQWGIIGEWEYTYDTNGNLTQEIGYTWNEDSSQWDNYWKHEYTYDTNGNLTLEIDHYGVGSQWDNESKIEFTYNNSYSFSDLILPYFYKHYDKFFNHMLTNKIIYAWDETLNDWRIDSNGDYSYSEQDVLSISEIIEEQLKIYPNPVSNILSIDSEIIPIDKVEIYSILGKKVKEINSGFTSIPTYELSNGVYIVRIYSENGLVTKKLIKKS